MSIPVTDIENLFLTKIADLPATDETGLLPEILTLIELSGNASKVTLGDIILWAFNNPQFTGFVSVPTAVFGTNNNQAASTQYVLTALGSAGLSPASFSTFGTVKVDANDPNPTVYLRGTIDTLLAAKANQSALLAYLPLSGGTITGALTLSAGLNVTGTPVVTGGINVSGTGTFNAINAGNATLTGTLTGVSANFSSSISGSSLNVTGTIVSNTGTFANSSLGNATALTRAKTDNSTGVATTAWGQQNLADKLNVANPAFTGNLSGPGATFTGSVSAGSQTITNALSTGTLTVSGTSNVAALTATGLTYVPDIPVSSIDTRAVNAKIAKRINETGNQQLINYQYFNGSTNNHIVNISTLSPGYCRDVFFRIRSLAEGADGGSPFGITYMMRINDLSNWAPANTWSNIFSYMTAASGSNNLIRSSEATFNQSPKLYHATYRCQSISVEAHLRIFIDGRMWLTTTETRFRTSDNTIEQIERVYYSTTFYGNNPIGVIGIYPFTVATNGTLGSQSNFSDGTEIETYIHTLN